MLLQCLVSGIDGRLQLTLRATQNLQIALQLIGQLALVRALVLADLLLLGSERSSRSS